MPRRPRLTPAKIFHITELCAKGLTAPQIAQQLDHTYLQVRWALRGQDLKPTPAPRGKVPRAVPPPKPRAHRPPQAALTRAVISADQQQFIARWQQSGIKLRELAQHLEVDWRVLSIELQGRKQITPTRLARLNALLTSLGA